MADNTENGLSFDVSSKGLDDVINKLSTITKSINSLNMRISNLNKTLGNQNLTIEQSTKNLNNASKSASNFAKSIGSKFAKFFSLSKVSSFFGKIIRESGKWIENLNLFAVTFNENYQETLDWALDFSNRLGVSNNEIVKMTGLFKQLSGAIGIADQTGDNLSKTLTSLAYDFASFYNIDEIDEVARKLQSGIFSGQVRTLRELGIDVSQESINTLLQTSDALSKLGTSATQLTQTQKVLARTIITMKSGVNAFGDMSRSIDTLQNRIRVFQGSLQNLFLALGDLFAEPIRDILAYLNGFIQAMTTLVRMIKPIQTELTYDLGDDIFKQASEDVDELEGKLGLLSFDKFEVLSSGGENENLEVTEALTAELEKQQQYYNQISEQFSGISESTNNIKNNILKWVFPNKTIEDLNSLLDGLTGQERLDKIIENLTPSLQVLIKSLIQLFDIMQKISKYIGDLTLKFLDITNKTIDWLDKNNMLESTLQAIVAIIIGSKLLFGINNIVKAITSLNTAIGGLFIGIGVFTAIYNAISSMDTLDKIIMGIVFAVSSLAIAMAALSNPFLAAIKIPLLGAAIGAGIVGIAGIVQGGIESINGFEDGGIPSKSELFYMNEYGVPEALINTGGSQTNVVNMQQLKEMTKQGFIEAINETGLINNSRLVLDARNVNDNAFARAIFPALKIESTRQGGNKL